MKDLSTILDLLAGAGDVGIYIVAFILWKFDRRLIQLEAMMGILKREVDASRKARKGGD